MPPTSNFRFFGIFKVFGPFSGFFVVGEDPSGSGDPFPTPESIFHARESNFHARSRFFVSRNRFLPPEDCFFLVFACFRGRGESGRVRGVIFLFRNRFCIPRTRCSCRGTPGGRLGDAWATPGRRLRDAWGTPGGLVLSCLVLT